MFIFTLKGTDTNLMILEPKEGEDYEKLFI